MKTHAAVACTACHSTHQAHTTILKVLQNSHKANKATAHAQQARAPSRAPAAAQARSALRTHSSQLRRHPQQRGQPARSAAPAAAATACACRARRRLRPRPDSQHRPHQPGRCTQEAAATSGRTGIHVNSHCRRGHPPSACLQLRCRAAAHHFCVTAHNAATVPEVMQPKGCRLCHNTNNSTQHCWLLYKFRPSLMVISGQCSTACNTSYQRLSFCQPAQAPQTAPLGLQSFPSC